MLTWNDHQPVESGTADHHNVTVDVLGDLECVPKSVTSCAMTQQWHSLANEPWPETKDHPFPSSELVMPPLFSQNPWLQELEMDVTIRRNLETASPPECCRVSGPMGHLSKEHAQEKNVLKRADARRLGEEHFPHRRHERSHEGHNSILGSRYPKETVSARDRMAQSDRLARAPRADMTEFSADWLAPTINPTLTRLQDRLPDDGADMPPPTIPPIPQAEQDTSAGQEFVQKRSGLRIQAPDR